jgi:hypothetical protein
MLDEQSICRRFAFTLRVQLNSSIHALIGFSGRVFALFNPGSSTAMSPAYNTLTTHERDGSHSSARAMAELSTLAPRRSGQDK